MADLKTNYVDDVLDTTKNQLRKYQQIQNDDGTVSFVDVTEYAQVGTSFGAKDINDTNASINDVNGKLNAFLSNSNFDINWLPNAFAPNHTTVSFTLVSNTGTSGSYYVPIFTTTWYDTSVVTAVWQFAITMGGVKRRYNTSVTSWSDWM
jgi:hypothetical protein